MVHLHPTPMRSRADSSDREASSYALCNRLSASEFCIESAILAGKRQDLTLIPRIYLKE